MSRGLGLGVLMVVAAGCRCGYDGAIPQLPEKIVGHCTYENRFSKRQECRDYLGEWSDQKATDDCIDQGSKVVLGEGCATDDRLGFCILNETSATPLRITLPGSDASLCGSSERGCEFFGGGIFDPAPVCGGLVDENNDGDTGLPTFRWPERVCKAPMPNEPAGTAPDGQVCTWQMISGATEEGRHFEDYADCSAVRTQRPYYAAPTKRDATREDSRLADPVYATEVAWIRQQIEATACVCCHRTTAPKGASNWHVDQPGNFINGFYDRGLAMGAGWIDTAGFGAFKREDNNGFSRATPDRPRDSIFVTTDPERMKRFFEAELAYRGLKPEDFAGVRYAAGPLDEQRFYRPTACENGEGVDADGKLVWRQGPARYVYVLEANASSPGAPPNLDTPPGTLWRIDVPYTGAPVESGTVQYGQVPTGFNQRVPEAGAMPTALERGKQYYLYVMADIAIPNTRCLFTVP